MGAGGIIQNQAKALLGAAMDPSIYGNMLTTQKDIVDVISAKPYVDRTYEDVRELLSILRAVCGC